MYSWDIHTANFEKDYLVPLKNNLTLINEKIALIETARQEAQANYQTALETLQTKSATGAALLTHIYAITHIDKAFETLKMNHPIIVDPDGTDAFQLVRQPQAVVQAIQQELEVIKGNYSSTSTALLTTYLTLYKNTKGKLDDKVLAEEAKALAKQAKKEKRELVPLTLYIDQPKNPQKPLLLDAFIFESITALVEQANLFYTTFKGDFARIYRDFSAIDASQSELSIKAYDPLYRDITGKDSIDTNTGDSTTYDHYNSSFDELVDKKGINPEDVDQGGLGDCYFLSSVASLAQADPQKIYGGEDAIIQGPNKEGIYTVRLYIPDENNAPKRVRIAVDPSFLRKTVTKKNAPANESPETSILLAQPSGKEMWVQLLEKALAQLEGSYQEIEGDKKDINYRGIQFLTGQDIKYHDLDKGVDPAIEELLELYAATGKVPIAQFGTKTISALKKAQEEANQTITAEDSEKKKEQPASGESYILYSDKERLYANHAYSLKAIASTAAGR